METKKYSVYKDMVHIIKRDDMPIALIHTGGRNRTGEVYSLKRMTGNALGEFLIEAMGLPEEFDAPDNNKKDEK